MNKVVHFEIPVDDMPRAKNFYSIFGWKLNDLGPQMGNYVLATTVETDEKSQMPTEPGGINGGLMPRKTDIKHPVLVIGVPSVDDYSKKVGAAGGKVVEPKMEIPGMGYYAYVSDTEGNIIGIFETLK